MAGAEERLFRFDSARAGLMVDGKQWDELLLYLDGFVAMNPHGGVVHPHPDLRFLVIERKVLDLVEAKRCNDALAAFESQAAPLLCHEDKLFFPLDLPDRLHLLKSHVLSGTIPEAYADVRTAIEDYIYVYFSNTNQLSSGKWEGIIREFFHFHPEMKLYRCRSCGWLGPDACAQGHFRHNEDNGILNLCSRMTMYLKDRVNIYDKKAAEPHDFTAFASRYTSKSNKRKQSSDSGGQPAARKGKHPRIDSNVSVKTMESSNVGSQIAKGHVTSMAVEVANGETFLSVAVNVADFCLSINQLFERGDPKTKDIRRLLVDQYRRIGEFIHRLFDENDFKNDIKNDVKKMMDVNLEELLPLVKLFPVASPMFKELDTMLYKLRWMCIGRAAPGCVEQGSVDIL